MTEIKARQLRRLFQKLLLDTSSNMDDSEKMEYADVYPQYEAGKAYSKGDVFKYGLNQDNETQLYEVVQNHTSQADWLPSENPALYKKIGFTEDNTPIWTQPLGAHDAYRANDIVAHKGKVWKSTTNNNTWEPGVYGWEEHKL